MTGRKVTFFEGGAPGQTGYICDIILSYQQVEYDMSKRIARHEVITMYVIDAGHRFVIVNPKHIIPCPDATLPPPTT